MRYKVPQDVQQADKIVGPLTAVQLVEAVVGGAVAYFFFKQIGGIPGILAAIVIGGLTAVFVFVRINELSFSKFLLAMALYLFRPRVRTWKKMADVVLPSLQTQRADAARTEASAQTAQDAANAPKANLRDITRLLDAGAPAVEDDDDLHPLEEDAFGKEATLERIRKLDARLRANQAHPVTTDA